MIFILRTTNKQAITSASVGTETETPAFVVGGATIVPDSLRQDEATDKTPAAELSMPRHRTKRKKTHGCVSVCRVREGDLHARCNALAPVMALLVKGRFFRFHVILLTPHHA